MRSFTLSLVLACLFADGAIAAEEFAPAVRIEAGGVPIDVAGFYGAAPHVADFDGDGLKDLLVGQEPGRLRIYRNLGTAEAPQFGDFEWLKINGEIEELPGGGLFRPQLVDWNGDGQLDIVTLSASEMVFWYERKANGEFANPEILRLDSGRVLVAGSDANCHVVDWDDDGDYDFVLSERPADGAPAADLWFVENKGSSQSQSLAAPERLKLEKAQIPKSRLYPWIADWNRDGKMDVLLGSWNGSVQLLENTGEGRSPTLVVSRELVAKRLRNQQLEDGDVPVRGEGRAICVADWDNDGHLDILLGDSQWSSVKPEPNDSAERLEKARGESEQVLSDFRRTRSLLKRLNAETQQKQIEFVQQKRKRFAKRLAELREEIFQLEKALQPRPESHGYVWLLRTKNP